MRWALLSAVVLLVSCPSPSNRSLPPGPDDPAKNLALLDVFADRVQIEAMRAAWESATNPHLNVRPKPFGIKPLLDLTDDEVMALNSRLSDPRQTQCLQAIHSLALRMQSESDPAVAELLAAIAPLREQIPDLSRVFTDEPELPVRKQLWYSQSGIARQIAPLLRQLVSARNRWAWRHARSQYLELMKAHRGYDPGRVESLEIVVRRALGSRAIPKTFPWEYEYNDPALSARMASMFDEAHCLRRASFVFELLGLPAKPPALQVSELKQASFSFFAFYPINPPGEQGITVRPGAGIAPHWSAFHEYGHAAMSLLTAPASCRTFRHPVSPAVSEGCAKITERLFYSEEWLQSQRVSPSEIQLLRRWERASELTRMRAILADIEFERVLYRDPSGDVMGEYIAIEHKTAGVEAGREFPAWALERHLAFEPLARVDYLLARCAQAAVYRRLRRLPGGLLGEAAQRVLREQVFRGAQGLRFEEWFRRATGAEPNCTAWLEDVVQVR